MQDLVRYIACSLVDHPDEVAIHQDEQNLALQVADSDLGKIIGRQGRTIKAMRVLVAAVAGKQGKSVTLDVVE